MRRSDSRILTTHTGSLPRVPYVQELLCGREDRQGFDAGQLASSVREAVAEVVERQQVAGIDVIIDGGQGQAQHVTYMKARLTGFEREILVRARPRMDDADFPDIADTQTRASSRYMPQAACTGPIQWKDWPAVERDIGNLNLATEGAEEEDFG